MRCLIGRVEHGLFETRRGKVLVARGSYELGWPSGSWSYWKRTGKLKKKGSFRGGRATGTWTFWNAAGKQVAELGFSKGQAVTLRLGVKTTGSRVFRCPQGAARAGSRRNRLNREGVSLGREFDCIRNQQRHGPSVSFAEDTGRISQETSYRDGKDTECRRAMTRRVSGILSSTTFAARNMA